MAKPGDVPNPLPPQRGGTRTIDGPSRKGLLQEKGQHKSDKGTKTAGS